MKAIILAAGFGTRMLPLTKTIPKELLPVGKKPVIQYAVEALSNAGIKNILMVTSQGKKALEDYFDKNYELEDILRKKWKLEILDVINYPKTIADYVFIKQEKQLGTGHAVLQTKPWISDDYFVVAYGDAIYPPNMFEQMINHFKEYKSPILVAHEVPKEETYKYWVVELDGDNILNIVEKPAVEDAPSNLVSNGVFLLPKEIFELLENTKPDSKSGEIYLPDAIKQLMLSKNVKCLKVDPFWDIGNPDALLNANAHFFENGKLF